MDALYQVSYGPRLDEFKGSRGFPTSCVTPASYAVKMTPSEVGERAEAAILAALVQAGKHVVLPFGGHRRYDLAYEEKGRLVKVKCKSAREKNGSPSVHAATYTELVATIEMTSTSSASTAMTETRFISCPCTTSRAVGRACVSGRHRTI